MTNIGTNIGTGTRAFFDRSNLDLSGLRASAEALQGRLSSGEKLSRSSDDPVAASRLRTLARAERLSKIDTANASRASTDLALADTALTSFADAIIRAQELATLAANDTLTDTQRASIGIELGELHGRLVDLANARDSAGHALFGGEAAGNAYALDASGNATYVGTASTGDLPLGDGQNVTRGVTGPEFLNFSVGGSATNLLAEVKALGDALRGTTADPQTAAHDALDAFGAGLDALSTTQTIVGSRLAWIDLATERSVNLGELRADEQAEIGATDIATTVADLQQVMLVLEASQASFARLASLSLFETLR
jgi:flagellar hook-associated protein 3 FlgL